MKKLLSLILTVAMLLTVAVGFTSCVGDGNTYTVGIVQLVQHFALDSATQGFKDVLTEEFGDKVTFIEHNASGESNACTTAANDLVTKNVDLILGNATAALQAVANATVTIPVLGTSITDYVTALGITGEFSGTVGGNISGTSDLAPLEKQAEMLEELFPAANYPTVGLLYCSAEPNSEFQADAIQPILEGMGYTVGRATFSGSSDVATVSTAAASQYDVLYVPTDNTAADCAETIGAAIGDTPLIAGESGICSGCGVATLCIDYYELGRITGKMAVKILKGEKKVSDMAIEYAPSTSKLYNADRCEELGITPPSDYSPISAE